MSDAASSGQTVVVADGDCISSIAAAAGHLPATIWDDPANRELRETRANPNVLLPGDVVFVPPLRPKSVSCATGRVHRFRRKAIPEKLRVQLLDRDGAPRPGVLYRVTVDTSTVDGETDDAGYVELWISPRAMHATLVVDDDEFPIRLGSLDPVDALTGLRARLVNLGYLEEDADDDSVRRGVLAFQLNEGLELTGTPDPATLARLVECHGT
ncbi:MAG TPA: peptidoglycan-binding domain-containing protein [Thermoanaerobaculia bacterium]|nr:peptidoglycan-binding domain-containing protein [Thermoanaerobaculia bacterium]